MDLKLIAGNIPPEVLFPPEEKKLRRGVIFSEIKRPYKLQSCLLILGAKREDIYSLDRRAYQQRWKSIYARYEIYELHWIADNLYKKSVKQYHPDLHSENRQFYEKKTAEINRAYQKIKSILQYH